MTNDKCRNCNPCNVEPDEKCLIRDYDCYDGCDFCLNHDYCKYEE